MKYTLTKRGKSHVAKDDTAFVTWMRTADLQFWRENGEFMRGYAHRKLTFEKICLRHDSEQNFVADLVQNNLLSIEKDRGNFWDVFKI